MDISISQSMEKDMLSDVVHFERLYPYEHVQFVYMRDRSPFSTAILLYQGIHALVRRHPYH